ncbi:MAG: TonB-dependent receptor, partial [Epsilonproteobacteria bacterium]
VDHIEIYQGGSSIAFGNEVGSMVIRLYSKDPSRENSRSAQLSIDNKSGASLRAVDAGTMGEYNYLFYANAEKLAYNTYTRNKQELSRDSKKYQAHFKISKDNDFVIEADGILNKTDIFNGFGTAPTDDKTTRAFGYINATKYFANNLEVSISASQEVKEAKNRDANGIKLVDGSLSDYIHLNIHSNTYKSSIKKKIIDNNSELLIGAEIQRKTYNVKSYDGLSTKTPVGPDALDIYMIYAEELYNIDKDNLITFSAKLDRYENNFDKDSDEYSLRFGYIGLFTDTFSSKIFAVRRYIYPSMVQTSFTPPTYRANPKLEASNIDMISGEIEYKTDSNLLLFGFAYKEIDDAMVMDKVQKMYVNKDSTVYFHRYYIRAEHYFDRDNKIIIEGFKAFKDAYGTPESGGLLQIFNTIGKFNIYNELVYRDDVTVDYGMGDVKTDASYDYTLSVSYEINRNLKLKAKGENLLDDATVTQLDPDGSLEVPAIERRVILTMEYTF